MIGINLIPDEIVEASRRSRRIRCWSIVLVVIAAAAAIPVAWQVRQHARLAALSNEKDDLATEVNSARVKLDDVTQKLADLNDRIKRADALRTKRSWAGLLALVTNCLPEEVWLTSLATEPAGSAKVRHAAPKTDDQPGDQQEIVVLDGARQLGLTGYALDHERLYDFMARLKETEAFAEIDLVRANKEPTLLTEAVRFELMCTW